MKYFGLIIFLGILLIAYGAWAEDGKDIFTSFKCGNCHKVDRGKTIPSLKEIARTYNGKEDQLLLYLKGEAKALINPERVGMMKRYIEKTKGLGEKERKALVDFILSHGD